MIKMEKCQYSPFFKIHKTFYLLRLMFGFPLVSTNDSFSEFEFKFWLELLRLVLYLCTGWSGMFYMFYIVSKYEKADNPMLSLMTMMRGLGYSNLDTATWTCMSFSGNVSNTLYFWSFKRALEGLNKVSRCLTKLNEEFHHLLAPCNLIEIKNETKKAALRSYIEFSWVIVFGTIAMGMLCYFFSWILFKMYPEDLSTVDKVTFPISIIMATTTYVYPPMAMSADTVVCCLIEETQNVFKKFKMTIAARKKLTKEDTGLQTTKFDSNPIERHTARALR